MICALGEVPYQQAHQVVLEHFVADPANVATNVTAGRQSISSIDDEVTGKTVTGYVSTVTVRSTYSQVADRFGLQIRKTVYTLETNATCTGFAITNVQSQPMLPIGTVDTSLSEVVQVALRAYLKNPDVYPQNRHSGDHTLRVTTPERCVDDQTASVNVTRIHHISIGLVYRTTSLRVNYKTGQIEEVEERPGRFLPSMCFGSFQPPLP